MLKKILIGLVVIVVAAIAGTFLLPGSTQVERSVVVNAPREDIHAILNSYQSFNDWSPWAGLDPEATFEFEGPVSGVGARMVWAGNDKVGAGSQEITASTASRIDVHLEFVGQGGGDAYFLLEDADAGTSVTWGFVTDHGNNPIARAMGPMISKYVGQDYQKGLEKFKSYMEAMASQ